MCLFWVSFCFIKMDLEKVGGSPRLADARALQTTWVLRLRQFLTAVHCGQQRHGPPSPPHLGKKLICVRSSGRKRFPYTPRLLDLCLDFYALRTDWAIHCQSGHLRWGKCIPSVSRRIKRFILFLQASVHLSYARRGANQKATKTQQTFLVLTNHKRQQSDFVLPAAACLGATHFTIEEEVLNPQRMSVTSSRSCSVATGSHFTSFISSEDFYHWSVRAERSVQILFQTDCNHFKSFSDKLAHLVHTENSV